MLTNIRRVDVRRMGPNSFQQCPVTGQGAMGTNWSTGSSTWTWRRSSSLWGWRNPGKGCPGRLWSLILWRCSRPTWTRSCAACCRCPGVLGLARTGLIFTGLQEGAQPGGRGWPHLAKQSPVFHTMCRHAGFRWGWGRPCGAGAVRESGFCFCRVFSLFVPFCSCSLCLLFCLNCPYPDPPVSACFFSFSSARRRGEGRPHGPFVAGGSRNQNKLFL